MVHKKQKVEQEIFLSLILDESYVQAGAWVLDEGKKTRILASTSERAAGPSWDDRIRMADHAIGKLEEDTGSTKLSKVVFGLGERFLTKDGDIEKSVRTNLKQLTKGLELTPLGFVPLSTGIAHFLRKSEGIPTSVILIGVTEENFNISIYRVGRLAFSISVKRTGLEGEDIENALKLCTDADVFPSRILLYGADDVRIEEVKSVLLKHQWTARANFLHYPKIEIYPFEHLIDTVVEAGANEITHEVADAESVESDSEEKSIPPESLAEEPHPVAKEEKGPTHMVVVQPETLGFHESDADHSFATEDVKKEKGSETFEQAENPLEFAEGQKENLLEKEDQSTQEEKKYFDDFDAEKKGKIPSFQVAQKFGTLLRLGKSVLRSVSKKLAALGVLIVILFSVGLYLATVYLPRATVTLSVLPKSMTLEDTVVIDPQATTIDTEKKIIPGKKLEKVVSGEKTVPATGRKKVGDPAKGAVTIYNKTLSSQSLKKGTVIQAKSLQFTLNEDISIASASEDLLSKTYGKADVGVTALVVGTEGNLPAKIQFTVKEYSGDVFGGSNDQPFTGGTSKDVTVVSRADYDSLLKTLTADLIEKAKTELTQSVSGKDRMIDQTVKTAVKEKQYVEEIDQEAKDLHGSLTVSVSASTYNEDDVKTLLSGFIQKDIPTGYLVNPGRTTVTIGSVTIGKDGKMTTKATITAEAIPVIEEASVKKMIAGKKLIDVEKELRTIPGVASAEFTFQSAWYKDALPGNPDHISVIVSTVE